MNGNETLSAIAVLHKNGKSENFLLHFSKYQNCCTYDLARKKLRYRYVL